MENAIDWIKENVTVFFDENISNNIYNKFLEYGFKAENVYSIGCKSYNDGKILDIIKSKKYILITFDKRFYKMAKKYNNFAILIDNKNCLIRRKSIISITINTLNNNIKKLKEYYKEDVQQISSSKKI